MSLTGYPEMGIALVKRASIAIALIVLSVACSKTPAPFTVAHRYTLTGTVVGLNAKNQTASIDAAAVPGFMEAMRMDYPISSKSDFDALRIGEKIKAILNVSASNDEYNLTGIQDQSQAQTPAKLH